MHMYTCMYMHMYMYMKVYVYMYACMCMCVCICMCMWMCVYLYVHVDVCVCVDVYVYVFVYVHVHVHIHVYLYVHVYVYVYGCVYMRVKRSALDILCQVFYILGGPFSAPPSGLLVASLPALASMRSACIPSQAARPRSSTAELQQQTRAL